MMELIFGNIGNKVQLSPDDGTRCSIKQYKRRPSRQIVNSEIYSIKKEYSALDFIPPEYSYQTEIEKETDLQSYYVSSIVKKWLAVFTLGIFIGTVGTFQSIVIEQMFILKYSALSGCLQISYFLSSIIWMAWTVAPIIGAFYVVQAEPTLKGSGVVAAIAYLNGVRIKRFHNVKTLWLQYLSVFLISAANMPGGREELFIHFGALSGAYITRLKIPYYNWRPFLNICDPITRRELVAAGTAAGVAVSFGTPIGAVLFCLEEGLTFWSPDLTFLMFLCTICSSFMLHLSHSIYSRGPGYEFDFMYHLFFTGVEHINLTYKYIELPIFFLMGMVGGLLGSLWNEGHIILDILRKRHIVKQHHKMYEVIALGLIISLSGIIIFHIFGAECIQQFEEGDRESRSKEMKVYCKKEKEFESIGIFLFQDLRNAVRSLFLAHKELISTSVLLCGAAYFFLFSELQLGTNLPSGILTPHLVCGASWGYLFGVWYSKASGENLTIAKYAFLGAVAQGSGVARLTLSLGTIMVESCGKQLFSIPIFIIVVTAKWFGGIFSRPIYRTEAYLEGYPLIRATLLPVSTPYKAKNIMIPDMVTLLRKMTVEELRTVLETRHQSFPVLEKGKVIGVINKYQIAIILKTRSFNTPEDIDELRIMNETFMEYVGESFVDLEEVISDKDLADSKVIVDLTKFMNPCPYLIHSEMSLRRIYLMFVALGHACAIVVNDNLDPVGIITRKDIACYRKRSQFLLLRTEVVPIT